MPATRRPRTVRTSQISSLPLPKRFSSSKSRRNPSATRSLTPNPIPYGSSFLQTLEPEQPDHSISTCEKCIQDFEHHRVFVDVEVFMKHVLHVPDNWTKVWGRTIRAIKRNDAFSAALCEYNSRCETKRALESNFYGPLVAMVNAVSDFVTGPLSVKVVEPKALPPRPGNGPGTVPGGVLSELSPDLATIRPHPLQMLEVEPTSGLLVDGSLMPRLKVNGRDPQERHARPCKKEKKVASAIGNQTKRKPTSAPNLPLPRKRPLVHSSEPDWKFRKLHRDSTPGGMGGIMEEPAKDAKEQKETRLQVGRYFLEQLSAPALRSHATVGVVDRDRIQFYHANHSVILVSSAISFSTRDSASEIEKFIAIVIAFSRLSLRDGGILDHLCNSQLLKNNMKLSTSNIACTTLEMLEESRLVLKKGRKRLELTLGEFISEEPSFTGRGTAVLHAAPSEGNSDLVVKISWPESGRVPEDEFLEKAIKKAKSSKRHKWALMHLPHLVLSQSVDFGPDSTHGRVAELFDEPEFVSGEYKYERRTLRIIVQERLYPLKMLTDVKEIAQVLLDVACIHRWLYEVAGILHRDLSPDNIMYRRTEQGEVCGVLTDFDLSSWTADLTGNCAETSQQRTGTLPYMAFDLLERSGASHLYRHDVESFFYVILMLATRYEIRAPNLRGRGAGLRLREGLRKLPYHDWFNQPSYKILSASKYCFFRHILKLDLSPAFEGFNDWLHDLHRCFHDGVLSMTQHEISLLSNEGSGSRNRGPGNRSRGLGGRNRGSGNRKPRKFNEGTLGGHVTYSKLISSARKLKGKLKGLTIRYDP